MLVTTPSKKTTIEPRMAERRSPHKDNSEARRLKALGMLVRNKREGMPLADCWYEVHPRSTAKRQTAAKEARREIMWLRENHRLHVEDELYIQDMGPERIVEQLKEQLEANRPFPTKDGNLIDSGFPDWSARYQATKTLMILLGIASRGFEPILDQGEKQNPPVEPITVTDALRKSRAEAIILRHHVEGLTLAKSWRRLHPSSGASNKTATKNARELLAWYDGTISHEMRPLCVAAGLSEDTVVEKITKMIEATLLNKDDDRFVDSELPDWSARKKALELWMVSLGTLLLGEKVAFAQPQKAEASDQGQHDTRATRETRDEKRAPASPSPSPAPERQRPRTATRNRKRMTLTDARRRYYAEKVLLLRLRDHTPAESWYETHPDSKAKPESARVLAQDEFAWYQRRYPNGLDELRRRAQSPPEQRHWRKRRNPDLIIAEMIIYLFVVEKRTLGECWQLVCPESTATLNSARGRAQRAATRCLRQFPEGIHIAVQRGSRAVRESLRDAA